jgi:hypothetical protein
MHVSFYFLQQENNVSYSHRFVKFQECVIVHFKDAIFFVLGVGVESCCRYYALCMLLGVGLVLWEPKSAEKLCTFHIKYRSTNRKTVPRSV